MSRVDITESGRQSIPLRMGYGKLARAMALTTRDATTDEYALFARLFPELAVSDPLASAEVFEREMRPRVIIASVDGTPRGYAFF